MTASDWIADTVAGLPPILSGAEVVNLLRTSRRNLYRLVASGRLYAVRAAEGGSSRLMIPRASVERYLRGLEGSDTSAPTARARQVGR